MSADQFFEDIRSSPQATRSFIEERYGTGLIPDNPNPDVPDELDRALENFQLTGKLKPPKTMARIIKERREKAKVVRKAQKTTEKKVVAGKAGKTENVEVETKVDKQLPLLPQERTNMYNTLNKMSQEQLRKYVSTFNKEARIVGGHAMKKTELINAIIQKAKQVEGLLAKLRVDVPKIDRSVATKESTGTRKIAKDKTGTKTRETEPKLVKPGEMKTTYKKIGGDGTFLAGYALKPASANRFDTLAQAQKACSGTDRCNGITKEVIKGKTYYSMRNGTTPMKKEGGGVEESWKKTKGKIIKLKDKK